MGACFGVESKDSVILEKLQANATIVDARGAKPFAKKHAEGAVNVPVGGPMANGDKAVGAAEGLPTDKSAPIVCHCDAGGEAAVAVKALKKAGYTDVINAGSLGRIEKLRAKIQPST